MKFIKIFLLLNILFFMSCAKTKDKTVILGDISNLPDGVIYLYVNSYHEKIDSAKTSNGKFKITYDNNDKKEPAYLMLNHVDKKGYTRAFSYPTSAKYNKGKYNSSTFLSDSLVIINGKIDNITPTAIGANSKIRFVSTSTIKAGYQTKALFHVDGDLFENINKDSYKKILSKIKEYPKSFHLLYNINDYRNSFSAIEVNNFLKSFKGEIVNSNTFLGLKKYNEKRIVNKKNESPILPNQIGEEKIVLDKNFNKHLVIFWASWCGPCRQEIPSLKKLHVKYKKDVDFVSISTDSNDTLWHKALEKENMPWNQFILDEKSKDYESIEIFFQLSKSIPYMLIIDNNMKVVKSHVGLMNENELDEFIKTQ